MGWYKGNAIYDALDQNNVRHFKYVTGDAWQLVYGDAACTPLLLVYVFGKTDIAYGNAPTHEDVFGIDFYRNLSNSTGIPYLAVQFRIDIDEVQEVLISTDGEIYESKSMTELMKIFLGYKLPISNSTTGKYLNDRISSAYHKWQRGSLGRALTVSDIDLYKVDSNNLPTTLYELKRSYYSLEKWLPFRDDYNNFRLLSNLCNRAGLELKILYNVRHKSPFFDDPSTLKLFSVNFRNTPPIRLDGILPFEKFISQ